MEDRSASRTPAAGTISVTKLQLQDNKEGNFPDVFPRFGGEMTATATPTLGKMSVNETCKVRGQWVGSPEQLLTCCGEVGSGGHLQNLVPGRRPRAAQLLVNEADQELHPNEEERWLLRAGSLCPERR
ncbi:unnamed protein product, partial [Gulo gulo]